MCQCQFSFLLDKKKKSTEFLFYPTSSPHKKTWKICKFSFACGKNLEGLMVYLVSYFANSIRRKLSTNGGISSFN